MSEEYDEELITRHRSWLARKRLRDHSETLAEAEKRIAELERHLAESKVNAVHACERRDAEIERLNGEAGQLEAENAVLHKANKAANELIGAQANENQVIIERLMGEVERLTSEMASLGEMMGDPIGGAFGSLHEAVVEMIAETTQAKAERDQLREAGQELVDMIDKCMLEEGYIPDSFTAQPMRMALAAGEQPGEASG